MTTTGFASADFNTWTVLAAVTIVGLMFIGDISKLVMILLMWLGRVEIIPVIVLFTHRYWRS